jgi:hypothetical protein
MHVLETCWAQGCTVADGVGEGGRQKEWIKKKHLPQLSVLSFDGILQTNNGF